MLLAPWERNSESRIFHRRKHCAPRERESWDQEVVNFGLPLSPGFLSDPRNVRVVNAAGQELSAAVRALEPWRIGGREGSIRSLLIQFTSDFSHERTQRIRIVFDQPRRKNESSVV